MWKRLLCRFLLLVMTSMGKIGPGSCPTGRYAKMVTSRTFETFWPLSRSVWDKQ